MSSPSPSGTATTFPLIGRRRRFADSWAVIGGEEHRADCDQTSMAADVHSSLASGLNVDALRCPGEVSFDPTVYQFRECVAETLGLDDPEMLTELSAAVRHPHDSESSSTAEEQPSASRDGCELQKVRRGAWRGPSTLWIQKWKAAKHTPPRIRFDAFYFALLREVILPHIGDANGICFQREPTFRCHVSGGGQATGVPHIDADYGHQPPEINFWVPMTPVWGSNSLYSESAPGRGDFEPFELRYGQIQRFWGNQVRHYTVPNETGSCRVSLDFRVVPKSCFMPRGQYPNGTRKDGSARFQVGEFYLEMDAQGNIFEDVARHVPHCPFTLKRPPGVDPASKATAIRDQESAPPPEDALSALAL